MWSEFQKHPKACVLEFALNCRAYYFNNGNCFEKPGYRSYFFTKDLVSFYVNSDTN